MSNPDDAKFLQVLLKNEKENELTTVDFIIQYIDRLFCEGAFDRVDEILGAVGPSWDQRQGHVMVSLLTSTLAAHHKLANRSQFYRQTRQCLLKKHAEIDTNQILRGLIPGENLTELKDQVTQIRDKIEHQVVKIKEEKTIGQEIRTMMDRADKEVAKDRILLERKFHQKEMDRHAKVIRSLDEQLSQLETGS